MAISALELLVSNLERRGARDRRRRRCYPRLCDLPLLLPAITGKVELVYEGEQQGAEVVARKLIGTRRQEALRRAASPRSAKELGSGGEDARAVYAPIVALVRRPATP